MKRLIIILCALAIALSLSGCRKEDQLASVPNPIATITMSDGKTMNLELFFQDAPNTVANFCELANKGAYDGLQVFRIVPSVLIQSGDPNNDGTGNAGYTIQGEFAENGIENNVSHIRGTISMARTSGLDSASSQFFILYGSYPEYDGRYAAFGRIMDEESYAVLDELATTPSDGNYRPVGAVPVISKIRVNTHGYTLEPAKIELPKETQVSAKDIGGK